MLDTSNFDIVVNDLNIGLDVVKNKTNIWEKNIYSLNTNIKDMNFLRSNYVNDSFQVTVMMLSNHQMLFNAVVSTCVTTVPLRRLINKLTGAYCIAERIHLGVY